MSASVPTVLVVCTANQCRSVMAGALLADRLGTRARVLTAGTHAVDGRPATDEAVRAMAGHALSLAEHRSRALRAELLDAADLVVTMTRAQLRDVVSSRPDTMPSTFTLRELARRLRERSTGPATGAPVAFPDLVRGLSAGRRPTELLGRDPSDDVADPTGHGDRAVAATAAELARLVDEVTAALLDTWAPGATQAAERNGRP